jgi:hypothetical protein
MPYLTSAPVAEIAQAFVLKNAAASECRFLPGTGGNGQKSTYH